MALRKKTRRGHRRGLKKQTRRDRRNLDRRNRNRNSTHRHKGGMCPCMMGMRGGDGVGAPTTETADGVPVPYSGLVAVPGESDSKDIAEYINYFGKVLDRDIVPESQDF